jgi:hypothetical protein
VVVIKQEVFPPQRRAALTSTPAEADVILATQQTGLFDSHVDLVSPSLSLAAP